mgnify:CR=1 FL=1
MHFCVSYFGGIMYNGNETSVTNYDMGKEEKTMKHRIKILLLAVLIAALCNCMLMIGMTKKKENNTIPKDASLICEETVSPNKDYITDEKDLVNYTVRVYQEKTTTSSSMRNPIRRCSMKHSTS